MVAVDLAGRWMQQHHGQNYTDFQQIPPGFSTHNYKPECRTALSD